MSKLPAAMIEKDEKAPASGKRLRPRWASGPAMAAWTAVGLALAYWIWPDAIVQKPLGDSRLETLLQAAAAIVVAVASLMIAVSAWLDS